MGRPRLHGAAMREALLDAAEELVAASGPEALSVRAVADAIDTTTRAVYSVFGSKPGLLDALAQRTYELLGAKIAALPETDQPGRDLVDAAVEVFRATATEHPSLFHLTFLRGAPETGLGEAAAQARLQSFMQLCDRVRRLDAADALGGRTVAEAALQFHALCEGLAVIEHRSAVLLGEDPETTWRDAIGTLIAGFATRASRTNQLELRANYLQP